METVFHQFHNHTFYTPSWEVKHLFLGTFNPSTGENVPYFYGRSRNQTWALISELFGEKFDPQAPNFFELLRKHKIACMDMIHAVEAPASSMASISGKGYKDTAIINGKVNRSYNTEHIRTVIGSNPGVKIYSTWGKGSNLSEWQREVAKLGTIIPMVSPSMAARVPKGNEKFGYMLKDWSKKI